MEEKIINEVNSTKRNTMLDIYKGILIFLVVTRHVLQYSVSDEGGFITNIIWAIQMPGFMLVAGYFNARKIDDVKTGYDRIIKSAIHYALPFIVWFVFIDVFLLGRYDRNLLKAFGLLIGHIDIGHWFLWVVFVLSLFTTVINICLSSKKYIYTKVFIILVIISSMLLLLIKTKGISFLGIKYIIYYSIFYGTGWIIKWTENFWKKWSPQLLSYLICCCILIFLGIVMNYDLYNSEDNLISIIFRCLAGFTGNAILLYLSYNYKNWLSMIKLDQLGKYTLEIYVSHVYVSELMNSDNTHIFFSVLGFSNFVISFLLTVVFTAIIILTFKSIPILDLLFFGKKNRK